MTSFHAASSLAFDRTASRLERNVEALNADGHIAGRQLGHSDFAPASKQGSKRCAGKTAIEFIASAESLMSDHDFVSRKSKCTALGQYQFSTEYQFSNEYQFASVSSSKASNSFASNCKALSKVKLGLKARCPGYRTTPKNTLPRVFQNLKRAALSSRVSRVVKRLAL